jgi:hypothetical protein
MLPLFCPSSSKAQQYVYVVLYNFPKSEKYSLAADIRRILWEAGTLLERAGVVPSKPDKLRLLQQADMKLSELKFLMRMGMELEFVPFEKYKYRNTRRQAL